MNSMRDRYNEQLQNGGIPESSHDPSHDYPDTLSDYSLGSEHDLGTIPKKKRRRITYVYYISFLISMAYAA